LGDAQVGSSGGAHEAGGGDVPFGIVYGLRVSVRPRPVDSDRHLCIY
jgi:hypothetical protein